MRKQRDKGLKSGPLCVNGWLVAKDRCWSGHACAQRVQSVLFTHQAPFLTLSGVRGSPYGVGASIGGVVGSASVWGCFTTTEEVKWFGSPGTLSACLLGRACSLWRLLCPGARKWGDWDMGIGTGQTASDPGCWRDPHRMYVCMSVRTSVCVDLCAPSWSQSAQTETE